MLQSLQALARGTNEQCIAVVQSGGDKGVDQLFSIWESESRAGSGIVTQVMGGYLAEPVYKSFKGEVGVNFHSEVGD